MEELFVAILSMLLVVALIPLYLWKRRQDSRSADEHQEEGQVCLQFFMLEEYWNFVVRWRSKFL